MSVYHVPDSWPLPGAYIPLGAGKSSERDDIACTEEERDRSTSIYLITVLGTS